jgi:hypothetical protein
MLKDDGTFLKNLDIPKQASPDSVLGTQNGGGKGAAVFIAPVQFLGQGRFIYVVQNKTSFPLLEVSEAGTVRSLSPRLPRSVQIDMLIPSESNLYARVRDADGWSIYEINSRNGKAVRHLQVNNDQSGADVACVNGEKFLSFKHGGTDVVPLVGTAEAVAATESKP